MRILAMDPGAERCGWGILSSEGSGDLAVNYETSGILGLHRPRNPQEAFQHYRLRLIAYWVEQAVDLFDTYYPDRVVNEIVPVVGGGNFVAATQSQLAGTVITTVQALAEYHGKPITQLGASTVKKKIGGAGNASKVKVRNGVLAMLPELEPRRREWTGTTVWDEVDAIAVGLTHLLGDTA